MKPRVYVTDFWYFLWAAGTIRSGSYEPLKPLGEIKCPLDLRNYMGKWSDGRDSPLSSLGFPAVIIYDKIMVTDYARLVAFGAYQERDEYSRAMNHMAELFKSLRTRGIICERNPPGFGRYTADTKDTTPEERAFIEDVSNLVKIDLRDREIIKSLIALIPHWPPEPFSQAFREPMPLEWPEREELTLEEEKEFDELVQRLPELCDEVADYFYGDDERVFTRLSPTQAEYLKGIWDNLCEAMEALLLIINTHYLYSASEGMDVLAYPWAMPFLLYKLFKVEPSDPYLQAFSNITLLTPVTKMSIRELIDLRSKLSGLSSEVGQYRQCFARKDIGGLIGSYRRLRSHRKEFLEYVMTLQGHFELINATISLTHHPRGVASFLVPDINFSQTFSFFRDIDPIYADSFAEQVFDLANNLSDAVHRKDQPTPWKNTMVSLSEVLDVFLASWLKKNGYRTLGSNPTLGELVGEVRDALSQSNTKVANFIGNQLDDGILENRNRLLHPHSYPDAKFPPAEILNCVCDGLDAMKFLSGCRLEAL